MPIVRLTSGTEFDGAQDTSILEAAAKSNILLPYSCKNGRCSACKCRLIQGESRLLQEETGLTVAEKAEGWILSCVRAAATDLVLDAEDLGGMNLPQSKTMPCRIGSIEKLAPDVIRVLLRLPPAGDFAFLPGQYIDVIGPGGMRRSYSLANASCADKQLELHIRAVEGGGMSQYWFGQAKVNDLLRLRGPLGTFFLRDVAGLDLVFLATGTGIAPIKGMLESMGQWPAAQQPRSTIVVWGGRTPHDLYFDVAGISDGFLFVPVLSRADAQWTGARGHVQQALLKILPDLSRAAAYACGSDVMINDAQTILAKAGLPSYRFYADAFVCSASN